MGYVIPILLGYLLGSSSMAYYISRYQKKDIRANGSGNLGASNATVLLGWKAGVTVALHDIAKAVVAVLLAKLLFSGMKYADAAAGVAAVYGHIFPFYLKFRGGKGLASFWGMTLALNWKLGLAAALVIFLATVITDFISIGALGVIVFVPVCMGLMSRGWETALIVAAASLVMFCKHWENIGRLIRKEEIGLRSTIRGEKRMK